MADRKPKARMFAALEHFSVGPDKSLLMSSTPKGVGWSTITNLEEAGLLVRVATTTVADEAEYRTTEAGQSVLAAGDASALPAGNRGFIVDVPDELAAEWIAAGLSRPHRSGQPTAPRVIEKPNDPLSSKALTTAQLRAAALTYPPRGLSRIEAARYIGVSTTKFDEMVVDGRMPRPKAIDARRVWDRHLLDTFFDELPNA